MRIVLIDKMRIFIAVFLLMICYGARAQQSSTILLVDDKQVLYRSGTQRVFHSLNRHEENPVIAATKPWEKTIAYCSVHRDEQTGKYQMWYQSWPGNRSVAGEKCYLCYATSDDGMNWVKPVLGLIEFNGNKENNLVMPVGYGGSVLFDPRDPDPGGRYKSALWEQIKPYGTALAFSPDGIHWTKYSGNPVIKGSHGEYIQPPYEDDPVIDSGSQGPPLSTSDVIDLIWDEKPQVYAIYAKTWLDGPEGVMHWKRAVVRTESKDFINWTKPQLVMAADEFDSDWGEHEMLRNAGGGGSGGIQFHSGPAFCYKDMYFSMLQVMDASGTGNMPVELAISHDGYNWERPFRGRFFLPPLDNKSRFDASLIWSNATPVFLKDEIRFYYGAYGRPWNFSDGEQISGIGFATLPRDRFAGVSPIDEVGQITFREMDLKNCQVISLNADATGGTIRAEILNADGYRVRGYSRDDAVVIRGDSFRHRLAWKNCDIRELPAGMYKLRLHLENAEVFAVSFSKKNIIEPEEIKFLTTHNGVRFGLWGKDVNLPSPTIFIFASSIEETLGDPYYRQCGNALAEMGYLCVSLDLPCHGQNKRSEEPEGLEGWRYRIDHGEEHFIAEFNKQVSDVLDHLIANGFTDPGKVTACGTSRGGFAALHFAASDARISGVAAFSPVTDLAVLTEFDGAGHKPGVRGLALTGQAKNLADRNIWLVIGDRDKRVGTDAAIEFASRVWQVSKDRDLPAGLELHIMPEPLGHTTPAGASDQAAEWILKTIGN